MKFSKGNGDGDKGKVILEAVKVLSLEHRSFKQLSISPWKLFLNIKKKLNKDKFC